MYNSIMKLIIQIPCYNEEKTLPVTYKEIPESIGGIDEIEILVIDDGSTDNTVETAKNLGVNLDADNQYKASDIEKLIQPVLNKEADIVIGARPIEKIRSFSPLKKLLQKTGSYVMRKISGADVLDAPSGFRAFSKNAAMKINIFDNYTYTMETIIQAQYKGLTIKSVPIGVNENLRPSRLVKNNFDYIKRSIFTMLRFIIIYRPFRFFMKISLLLFFFGLLLGLRFLYFYITESGEGHIQSLILCAILILVGVQSLFFAVIADLLAINRKLIEDVQLNIKK